MKWLSSRLAAGSPFFYYAKVSTKESNYLLCLIVEIKYNIIK